MQRCDFVDAARGVAIVPMVVNHTGHYWLAMSIGSSSLFYFTETTAAPLFLFIAGFSLALSRAGAKVSGSWALVATLRAVLLILLGYVLNVILFPGHWLYLMGPLQTIGLSILLLIPLLPYLSTPWMARLLVVLAGASYGLLVWQAENLAAIILNHPVLGEMFFFSLPPWPWAAFVVLGAVLGSRWCAAVDKQERGAILSVTAMWGVPLIVVGLLGYSFLGWRDYVIYFPGFSTWLPGVGTALWITGLVPVVLFIAYQLQQRLSLPRWLLDLGRSALLIYVVHRIFIILITAKLLHFTVATVWIFMLANLFLLFALVELAKLRNAKANISTVAQHRT